MRILLTGGAGFIGSHLAERLVEQGADLTILDDFNDSYSPLIKEQNIASVKKKGPFSLWREDLRNRKVLTRLFREAGPQIVVHLAARAGVRPSLEDPVLYNDVNVNGTLHLLELARQHDVRGFILGSSSSVYGINSKVPFQEDGPLNQPISPYAASKRAAELFCHSYHHNFGLPVTILRFFTVYGPRQRPEMAIHKFTRMIQEDEEIPVYHQGKSQRDYTYIDDIVQGIMAVVKNPFAWEVLNLGNSHSVALLKLIRLIENALGKSARINLLPPQKGDVPVTCADISRARARINYRPDTMIDDGVTRFVDWFKGSRNAES